MPHNSTQSGLGTNGGQISSNVTMSLIRQLFQLRFSQVVVTVGQLDLKNLETNDSSN